MIFQIYLLSLYNRTIYLLTHYILRIFYVFEIPPNKVQPLDRSIVINNYNAKKSFSLTRQFEIGFQISRLYCTYIVF